VGNISLDGKTVRGSFDKFNDQKAIQVLSAFVSEEKVIIAQVEVTEEKTNEIPVAQRLVEELGLEGVLYTADAMHCQKKV
jgi:hypothetical protein